MSDRALPNDNAARLTVCYNGSCPVCRTEIEHYQRVSDSDAGLAFQDVATDRTALERFGVRGDDAFRRLHAITPDGRLLAGVSAFAALWEQLPRYRWLAALVRHPVVAPVAGLLYERVAAPLLYARYRARRERNGGNCA